jgi:hypothetical protein
VLTIIDIFSRSWRSPFRRPWRKNLVDQSIIRWLERDESDALQDESILQIFSQQAPHDGSLCRSPQHRVPELQSVSSDGLLVIGRLYCKYSTPSIDRPSDVLDWYSRLRIATWVWSNKMVHPARIARAIRPRARSAFASATEAVA